MRNFFKHQNEARGRTATLVAAMGIAVAGTALVTALMLTSVVEIVWWQFVTDSANQALQLQHPPISWGLIVFWFSCLVVGTTSAMGLVSHCKIQELRRGGGAVIAEQLGGTLLTGAEAIGDLRRQQALNIVQEMAIASGIPVPPLYILSCEPGINAFAAGFCKEDAIVALTDGCLQKLNRDQLQGVVAHEFSHIFNGDMRMNLKLLGWLHGVLGVSVVAEWMFLMGTTPLNGDKKQDREKVGHPLALLVGILLWPVGMIGLFFSTLIKAALSRQREFLADASAVEFTRNPEGLAGALKVIAGYPTGSRVQSPGSLEVSHLFFANGRRSWLRWLNSHPPVSERIRRLDPQWNGAPIVDIEEPLANHYGAFQSTYNLVAPTEQHLDSNDNSEAALDESPFEVSAEWMVAGEYADSVRNHIPQELWEVADDPFGAAILFLALWFANQELDRSPDIKAAAIAELDSVLREGLGSVHEHVSRLESIQRLWLLDATYPLLDQLGGDERGHFKNAIARIAAIDSVTDPFCWTWRKMAQRWLQPETSDKTTGKNPQNFKPFWGACEILLSTVCRAGNQGSMAEFAFQRAASQLGSEALTLRNPRDCTLETVDLALGKLRALGRSPRERIVLACSVGMTTDREINQDEALLLRGICADLGFAPPTLLPGQPVLPGA